MAGVTGTTGKAGPLNFPEGTAVFRVSDQLGKGELFLFSENVDPSQEGIFLLDVFEKASEVELEVQTDRDAYLSGQTLSLGRVCLRKQIKSQ